jgi:hypothetical protein
MQNFVFIQCPGRLQLHTVLSVKGTHAKLTRFHPDHTEEMQLSHIQKSIGINRHCNKISTQKLHVSHGNADAKITRAHQEN